MYEYPQEQALQEMTEENVDAGTHEIVAAELTRTMSVTCPNCRVCLTRSMLRLHHSQRMARMMARSSTMRWPTTILTLKSSFHPGRRQFQMKLRQRSAIGTLQ